MLACNSKNLNDMALFTPLNETTLNFDHENMKWLFDVHCESCSLGKQDCQN